MLPGFYHPKTRTYGTLLGPCFKTGHMKSYDCQQSWHSLCTLPLNSFPQFIHTVCSPPLSKTNWERRGLPKRTRGVTPLLDLSLHTTSYNTTRNQLPSCGAYEVSTSFCPYQKQPTTSNSIQLLAFRNKKRKFLNFDLRSDKTTH